MSKGIEFVRIRIFIDGQWVDDANEKHVPLYNPSTGEIIGEVPLSSQETALHAVESAHRAYDSWRALPLGQRVGFLYNIRAAMQENLEELAYAIAIDQAKHISEARGEVLRVIANHRDGLLHPDADTGGLP